MKDIVTTLIASLMAVAFFACSTFATEYHVMPSGADTNPGTEAKPLQTISAAARLAQPGDTVTVHQGVYREWVNPPRGGTTDAERIVYRAAPGEEVVIKGSEVVKNWEKVQEGVWRVTLPNQFFGDYNPYTDVIGGEWYYAPRDRFNRHTGMVYLEGTWLDEAKTLEQVLSPTDEEPYWKAQVDGETTTIWARFGNTDPNEATVEINVRRCVFYPDETGRNYITVRGFTMRHAATPWSGAMSEQFGLIGTHWSKGWIIENNVISHSMNTGITLGRYDLGKHDVAMPKADAPGFVESCEYALKHGWSKENIGGHVVRGNHISHCEKNGIHGSLGGVFSTIENNTICDIALRRWINGPDIAGLKLLASNDGIIRNNHIYRCGGTGGIWLDWMAQGTRVTGNLLHDNSNDLFMEVNHGPFMIDNNLFLSRNSLRDWSQGGVYVHNLFAGEMSNRSVPERATPYFKPHTLKEMKVLNIVHRDLQFYNNLFVGQGNLSAFEQMENVKAAGNVFLTGLSVQLTEKEDGLHLSIPKLPPDTAAKKRSLVTTDLLGKAHIPDAPFVQADGTPYRIDKDYFGAVRDVTNPSPGPFRYSDESQNPVSPKPTVINDRALGGKVADYPEATIAGTDEDRIYQSCRYNMGGYVLSLPNGTYQVVLKFCEPHFSAAEKRVCDVRLQGETVLKNFDIFAEVGQFAACDKTFEAEVNAGVLRVDIINRVSMACISGIEIRGDKVTKRINCGGGRWQNYAADPGDSEVSPYGKVDLKVWPK